MNIEITDTFHALVDGVDYGHVADAIINNINAVDPQAPAESVSYCVARALVEKHETVCADKDAQHAEELQKKDEQIAALLNPSPTDPAAIEAAARRRAEQLKAERQINARAQELAET